MCDRPNNVSLVIDTSRQRPSRLLNVVGQFGPANHLLSPGTSSSSTTIPWSSNAWNTPSTGLTTASAFEYGTTRTPGSASADPEWLISKIDEYLADLDPQVTTKSVKSTRRSLKIEVSPEMLLAVEQALPSSPDAIRMSGIAIPPPLASSRRPRPTSLPTSPMDFDEGFSSPLFYRAFQRPDGRRVNEDAAPFPYSPCRESVSLDPGCFGTSLFHRLTECDFRQTGPHDDILEKDCTSRIEAGDFGVQSNSAHAWSRLTQDQSDLPSIRLETTCEEDTLNSSDGGASDSAKTHPSPPIIVASVTSNGADDHFDTVEPAVNTSLLSMGLSASAARNLSSPSNALSKVGAGERPTLATQLLSRAASEHTSSTSSHVHTTPRSQTDPLVPLSLPARRSSARSASADNLTRPAGRTLSVGRTEADITTHSPESAGSSFASSHAVKFAAASPPNKSITRTNTPSSSPLRAKSQKNCSPTSTQIVEGVRKMNKLKKLLGEEVGSHISPTTDPARWGSSPPSCTPPEPARGTNHTSPTRPPRRGNTMKPLPCVPQTQLLHRSNTAALPMGRSAMPGSQHRPQEKKCCVGSNSTGRPSTARDTRCNCPNCIEVEKASQRLLTTALAGTSLRLPSPNALIPTRPSTASSVKSRSGSKGRSFFDLDD